MIDAQRGGAVVQVEVKLHQLAISRLVQRVGAQQLLGIAERLTPAARLRQKIGQLLQRILVQIAQPLAFGHEPLVVRACIQIPVEVGQTLTQARQQRAQVLERLFIVGVGPNLLAWAWVVAVEEQIGEQALQAWLLDPHMYGAREQGKVAKQLD